MNKRNELKDFINGYLACAAWSSSDVVNGEDVQLDDYEWSDSAEQTLIAYAEKAFNEQYSLFSQFVEETSTDYSQAGHSFWLSTNGHGAGFFDFTKSPAAMALEKLCDQYMHNGALYGGFDLYVDDDLIYV